MTRNDFDMNHPVLVNPSMQYKESYLQAFQELVDVYEWEFYRDFQQFEAQDFDGNVQASLPYDANYDQHYIFWMVDREEFIGRIYLIFTMQKSDLQAGQVDYMIRPSKRLQGYGREILRLGLEKFRERGISPILISCASDNFGSKKIIEANGGIFENEIRSWDPLSTTLRRLRYWIHLD